VIRTAFEPALLGRHGDEAGKGPCRLELATGEHIVLPIDRWRAEPEDADELLLRHCTGPTLDIGCGPGRLTAALVRRGVVALGVDISPVAVRLTADRGAPALRRDVFGQVPGEGRWRHALLADGNIGIGGDPVRLLRRVEALLSAGGSALVEIEPPGHGMRRDRVRVDGGRAPAGAWFDWAWLGVDGVEDAARHARMSVRWIRARHGRWFTELTPAPH
jgi:SAM-dependent methyltransferase